MRASLLCGRGHTGSARAASAKGGQRQQQPRAPAGLPRSTVPRIAAFREDRAGGAEFKAPEHSSWLRGKNIVERGQRQNRTTFDILDEQGKPLSWQWVCC